MKKTKILLSSLTAISSAGLICPILSLASCNKVKNVTVKSLSVNVINVKYFKVGDYLSDYFLKVEAEMSDGSTQEVVHNSDGENGYKLIDLSINHTFTSDDIKEDFEIKASYKGVVGTTTVPVSANVDSSYNEHVQTFKMDPVILGKDLEATFVPEEGYVIDTARTGLYVGDKKYTVDDNPDVVQIDSIDNSSYTLRVAGTAIVSDEISLGVRCKSGLVPVEYIGLDKSMVEFVSGSEHESTVTATVYPTSATSPKVKWEITSGSDLIKIESSGENNEQCKVTSLGTAGIAEIKCTSEAYAHISATCKVRIEDPYLKLYGDHNLDLSKANPDITITTASSRIETIEWSLSDDKVATIKEPTSAFVKISPTEYGKKYGGFTYLYAYDPSSKWKVSFPISIGSFGLLDLDALENGVAKWRGVAPSSATNVVIPSWYILEDENGLTGVEVKTYLPNQTNTEKVISMFIPYSIVSIPYGAFAGMTNLYSVIVDYDNQVYTSGGSADESKNKLFNAVVNKTNKTLIAGCKGTWLDNVEDSPIQTIGTNAFANTGLTKINIPSNIHELEVGAFAECSTLTEVTFSGIEQSKWTIWNEDHSINDALILDADVTTAASQIKDNCTYHWNNINYVEFKEVADASTGIVSYEVYTEETNASKVVGKLVIPTKYNDKEVTGIYYNESTTAGGFENCVNITSVYVPSTITYISDYAFRMCDNLSEFVIEKLEYVGRSSFHLDFNLREMTINDNALIAMDIGAFAESGINKFTIPATCTTIGRGAFLQSTLKECTIEKPTTGYRDWRCLLEGNTISIDAFCIAKGKESIYTNKKVAADMLRFSYSESAKIWGFANIFWDTTLIM